jgi:hypothetical protein
MLPEPTFFALQPISKALQGFAVLLDLQAEALKLLHDAGDLYFEAPDPGPLFCEHNILSSIAILINLLAAGENLVVVDSHAVLCALFGVHVDDWPQLRGAHQQRPDEQVHRLAVGEAHHHGIVLVDFVEHFVHLLGCQLPLLDVLLRELDAVFVALHLFGHLAAGDDFEVLYLNLVGDSGPATALLAPSEIGVFLDFTRGDVHQQLRKFDQPLAAFEFPDDL